MMRVLSVRQPYAGAIVAGVKLVENRGRATDWRGPLAIAAGVAMYEGWWNDQRIARWQHEWIVANRVSTMDTRPKPWNLNGRIVGVVELVDVCEARWDMRASRRRPCECGEWAEDGQKHWRLANPRVLAEPIPWRGAQWLQTPTAEQEAEILGAVA